MEEKKKQAGKSTTKRKVKINKKSNYVQKVSMTRYIYFVCLFCKSNKSLDHILNNHCYPRKEENKTKGGH